MTLLIENGLARLGELKPGFVPWDLTPRRAMKRVGTEWWDPEKDLSPGNICWLENTPAGDEIARRIEAEREG